VHSITVLFVLQLPQVSDGHADVRISLTGSGFWSYLGTDITLVPDSQVQPEGLRDPMRCWTGSEHASADTGGHHRPVPHARHNVMHHASFAALQRTVPHAPKEIECGDLRGTGNVAGCTACCMHETQYRLTPQVLCATALITSWGDPKCVCGGGCQTLIMCAYYTVHTVSQNRQYELLD
jgi:hypothetical protein